MKKAFAILPTVLIIFAFPNTSEAMRAGGGVDFFEKKIRPILSEHCYRCHSQEAQKAGKLKAELLLDTRAGVLKGGESGPILVAGKPADSLLMKVLAFEGDVRMPPKGRLPESVVRDFATWISMGAPDPRGGEMVANRKIDFDKSRKEHWAFQPLHAVRQPSVKMANWPQNPLDAFILKKLEDAGVQPTPPADPATLLRRVYFDLIGLPPSPEEQQAFLRDPSPEAYAKIVEDLLQRPQYGERWGRHWLDVARYAESLGFEVDEVRSNTWRYRDWVIDAFNADMPYDQFLTEQLAGDEVKGTNSRSQIATSFLRLGTFESNAADKRNARYIHLDDILSTVSMAFLGQTMQCARCHDHKFEPILQEDYYRMLAIFEPLDTIESGGNVKAFPVGSAEELAKVMGSWQAKLAALYQPLNEFRLDVFERYRKELLANPKPKFNEQQLNETMAALKTAADQRTKQQTELLLISHGPTKALDDAIKRLGTAEEKAELARHLPQIADHLKTQPQPTMAHIYRENGLPETWLFSRGETNRKVRVVFPGAPAVLGGESFPEPDKKRFADTSGRRLWLADWMTTNARPLVARVMVNRIWQQHLGRGFVDDANNLGLSGGLPTHPELLEWLANDFIAGGWSMKRMHRQIVLSSTYKQGSKHPHGADPEGKLFARWVPRHLEAEAVRDAMLSVSGKLDLKMGGPSVRQPLGPRRSIYLFLSRLAGVPVLDLLGLPDLSASAAQRSVSVTSIQALLLFNGEFSAQQARFLAERLKREAGADMEARIRLAYTLVFCRTPSAQEMRYLQGFLQQNPRAGTDEALASLCLVLLNASEFVYLN